MTRASDATRTAAPLPISMGDTANGDVPHPVAEWPKFMEMARQRDEIMSFSVAGDPWVFMPDPHLAAQTLKRPFDEIGVGPLVEALTSAGGSGETLVANYDPLSHRARRAVVQQPLTSQHLRTLADVMARRATALVASWHAADELDVEAQMASLNFDILAEALFSEDVEDAKPLIIELERARQSDIVQATVNPAAARGARTDQMMASLDEFVYGLIERRRGQPITDLLGSLVNSTDANGNPPTNHRIRSEAVSLFFAGYATVALTLTFAALLLAANRTQLERLRREARETLGGRRPTFDDLGNLPFARQVAEETLRLYPVSNMLDRRAVVDTEIGGYHIPAGTALIFSAWLAHRDARYFPNPFKFDPDRFAPNRRREIPADAYFPFGDGRHVCVGNRFALMQISMVLIIWAQHWDWVLKSSESPAIEQDSTLRPSEPVIVQLLPS